jgi:hypothetical protein
MHSSIELATLKLYLCNIHKNATGTHGPYSCNMKQTWQGLDSTACGAHGRGQPADTVVGEGDGSRWGGSSLAAARSFSARLGGSCRCAQSPLHGAALPGAEPPPLAGMTRLAGVGERGPRGSRTSFCGSPTRGSGDRARAAPPSARARRCEGGELRAAVALAGSGAGAPSESRAGPSRRCLHRLHSSSVGGVWWGGVVEVGGVQQLHHLRRLLRERGAAAMLVVIVGAPGTGCFPPPVLRAVMLRADGALEVAEN